MKIYVASSWKNAEQPAIVAALREDGHEVYDFRNPEPGNHGFAWGAIDTEWRNWTAAEYIEALCHPVAQKGFRLDFNALERCDACVLVLPSGRSAHLEAGWAAGAGKPVYILTRDGEEPELMAKMATSIVTSLEHLRDALQFCESMHAIAQAMAGAAGVFEMTDSRIEILRHALGLDRSSSEYRNHFFTSEASVDWDDCMQLTAAGFMERQDPPPALGGARAVDNDPGQAADGYHFFVTEKGKQAARGSR